MNPETRGSEGNLNLLQTELLIGERRRVLCVSFRFILRNSLDLYHGIPLTILCQVDTLQTIMDSLLCRFYWWSYRNQLTVLKIQSVS